jgi:hypothetical protein
MAFIALRRSRNTRSYYLVESYRDDQGRSRKRTLCYLGREQDGTDTPEKALAHWRQSRRQATRDLASAHGDRRRVLRDRIGEIDERIGRLRRHIEEAARIEAERQLRQQAEEEARRRWAEEAELWRAIEQLRQHPTAENAKAAKRAFRILALRLHPDQGGSHEAFIRLKQAYERAVEGWQRVAA